MVYLPEPMESDPFVASMTGPYGGARRRLRVDRVEGSEVLPGVLPDVERKRGSVFLAHHNNASGGSSGPDGVPWTAQMLQQAFESPAVLGLEFWNENIRLSSEVLHRSRTESPTARPGAWFEDGYQRDSMTVAGNDLELVDQKRKGLATTGLFDLGPFDRWFSDPVYEGVEDTLRDGAATWDQLNTQGITPQRTRGLAWLPLGQPRKMFIAAGSDAHGDFNYRREGYMKGTTAITDTALGSPRNLTFAGPEGTRVALDLPPVHGAGQVLRALRATATDGPAARLAFDRNGNGIIDDLDPMMGDTVDIRNMPNVPILVQWESTPEFGPVSRIELTVGVWESSTIEATRLYSGGLGLRLRKFLNPESSYQEGGFRYSLDSLGYWNIVADGPTPVDGTTIEETLFTSFGSGEPSGTKAYALPLAALTLRRGGPAATRLFVRATIIGQPKKSSCSSAENAAGDCLHRYAFTNPIWIRDMTGTTIPVEGPTK